MTQKKTAPVDPLAGIQTTLRLTRVGMVTERMTKAFWPLWSVLISALACLMLGLQDNLPRNVIYTVIALIGVGGIWALIYGIKKFKWPSQDEAREKLDQTLVGAPIRTVLDDQAVGAEDAASRAVWRAHQTRMKKQLDSARAAPVDLKVSKLDPYALRYMALLAFLVAILFGTVSRVNDITRLADGSSASAALNGPSWEGWINPPAYTGKPSLYLNDFTDGVLDIPKGSEITLRLYGKAGALKVHESISGSPIESSQTLDTDLIKLTANQNGILEIEGESGSMWDITLIADAKPAVKIGGELKAEARGQMSLPFKATDDYEVVSGNAVFTLDLSVVTRRYGLTIDPEPRDDIIVDLPMPIRGDRSDFTENLIDDFSKHPWAGLPVSMVLTVSDALEQTGTSEPLKMVLPGRRFFGPLASAVIEQRRDLLWSRQNGTRVAQVLRAVINRPEGFVRNNGAYLMLRVVIRRLESAVAFGFDDQLQTDLSNALWDVALILEDGSLADAKERLKRAQERLAEAMRNGASKEEIAELMQELRDATKNYTDQLAQQQQENNGLDEPQQAQNQEQMIITSQELEALMDRIQELMEQGRMAEAQDLMEQMNDLMENLQAAQNQPGGGDPSGQGEQAMEDLKDTLRNQQDLSDQAFRDLQEQFNPDASGKSKNQANQGQSDQGDGGTGKGGGNDGNSGEQDGAGSGKEGLAERQQALRNELQRQQDNLPGAGTAEGNDARESLGRAGDAMDRAEQSLRDNNLAQALDDQAAAIEALREGMRNLGDAMARAQQQQSPGQQGQTQGRESASSRDPLGRDVTGRGKVGTGQEMLQGEDVYRRAGELLDEIRRRSGEQERPDAELEYLERLLEQY